VEDPSGAEDLARLYMVDVISAVDDSREAKRLEELPGFSWRGRSPYGPLDPVKEDVVYRVMDASTLVPALASTDHPPMLMPRWDPGDPLAALFAVWFGEYEPSDYGNRLRATFGEAGVELPIESSQALPYEELWETPIRLSSHAVSCSSYGPGIGFVAVDPAAPMDLIAMWNLRADGGHVFPWPFGFDDQIEDAAKRWVDAALTAGRITRPRMGTGEDGPLQVYFWSTRDEDVPERLAALLASREVQAWRSAPDSLPMGWTGGSYPLSTEFEESFTAVVDPQTLLIEVPLPRIDFLPRRRRLFGTGVIAAQLESVSERGLPPGLGFTVPSIRRLAPLLDDYVDYPEPFHRGTGDGRVVGSSAEVRSLKLRLLPYLSIVEKLLSETGRTCAQTDDGRFTGRLIELLGGPLSHIANQPAVRAVLSEAAGSHRGRPIASLLGKAKNYQGSWPGPIAHPEAVRRYPQAVVNHLLSRKMLRPALPIKCPRCATETAWDPDAIATTLECPMCEEQYPLGLALSIAGRRIDWLFRLPGNIPSHKLAEAFPIAATLGILAQYGRYSDATLPHVLGLSLEMKEESREIDIVAILNDRGLPVVLVGETKSYRDDIDQRDLETLVALQRDLQATGLETFIVLATLRDTYEGAALQALREVCEQAPATLHYSHGERVALPIALVARDLSAHPMSNEYPTKWVRHSYTLAEFAMESCRQNLGLDQVTYERKGDGFVSKPVWRT
jgi:hypothetical protein